MEYKHRVAVAVREAIEQAGQTTLGISEATGIPRVTLIRRLGGTTAFKVDELALIAAALDVPVSALTSPAERVA